MFDHWGEISERVHDANTVALFLDFDGTLVSYRRRPHQVSLNSRTRTALQKLAGHPKFHIVIISGRRRATLMDFIKIPGIHFHGLYGWEKEPDFSVPKRTAESLDRMRVLLSTLAGAIPGIWLEDKEHSLAVHFRNASAPAERTARASILRFLVPYSRELHVIRATHTWEVAPRQIRDKGGAVRAAMKSLPKEALPIYLGDDLTDEPAFIALQRGITVHVGPQRPTAARFRLRDPDEACVFLEKLAAEL